MESLKSPSESLSILNDPFIRDKITKLAVRTYKSCYGTTWYHTGEVAFKNGNTEAEQKFDGKSFDDVVLQIKDFLNTLR